MYFTLPDQRLADPTLWLLSNGAVGVATWPQDPTQASVATDFVEAHGLAPVAKVLVDAAGLAIPPETRERLEGCHSAAVVRSDSSTAWATRIDRTLHDAGVPARWLKGAAWGRHLYQNVGPRPMRDLDVIVDPEQIETAEEALRPWGFIREPGAAEAGQHIPRLIEPASRTRVDLHHHLMPPRIYGFDIDEPDLAAIGPGLPDTEPRGEAAHFHLLHMYLHAFHHSFYNLRLMHLYDIHLALTRWEVDLDELTRRAANHMPAKAFRTLDAIREATLGPVDRPRYDGAGGRVARHFLHRGSLPLSSMMPIARSAREARRVAGAELARARFVLFEAPGRWGRRPAELHPPG